MRHWTPEERQRQSEIIRQWRPWAKSTGARTAAGKAVCSKNVLVGNANRAKALAIAKQELAAAQAKIQKLSGKKEKLSDWERLMQFSQTLSF